MDLDFPTDSYDYYQKLARNRMEVHRALPRPKPDWHTWKRIWEKAVNEYGADAFLELDTLFVGSYSNYQKRTKIAVSYGEIYWTP